MRSGWIRTRVSFTKSSLSQLTTDPVTGSHDFIYELFFLINLIPPSVSKLVVVKQHEVQLKYQYKLNCRV